MRASICSAGLLFFLALPALALPEERGEGSNSGRAVIREMNLARQSPALYAGFVRELRSRMNGNVMVLPGGTRIRTREATRALDDAIRFLEKSQSLPPLVSSPGMSRAAEDHCADQAGGGFGHEGKGGSHGWQRIARYGMWSGGWGENVSYGKSSARDIVLALIIDDGLPARKHRQNIFNPGFSYAGAAIGPHARFGTVCSMDFAGSYAERGQESTEALVARNF